MPRAMQAVVLVPHPATPSAAVRSIFVRVRREGRALALDYRLSGDVPRLRLPQPAPAARAEGLWRHTCFELFVAARGAPAYQEFDFSPSGEWAAYAFAAYREDAAPLECRSPALARRESAKELALQASVGCAARGPLRLGLSAVVEDAEGALSYWALLHRSAKPDFHDAASFALELDEARH